MRVDGEGLKAAVQKYASINAVSDPAAVSLEAVINAAENAEDAGNLIWIAILLFEPLLDCHWNVIADAFGDALRNSPNLRKAFHSADTHTPDDVDDRLRAITKEFGSPDEA